MKQKAEAMVKSKSIFSRMETLRVYLLLLAVYVVACIITPAYFSVSYLNTLLLGTSMLGILSIGQTLVILTGGIDMSICYSMTFSAVVTTQLVRSGNHVLAAVIGVAICVVVGLINGLGVAFVNIPPIIMTLAMNSILLSMCMIYTNGTPKGTAPAFMETIVNGKFLGLRGGIWIWIITAVIVIIILAKSTFGRKIIAVGSNREAARFSGIKERAVLVSTYTLSGLFVGIAMLVAIGYSGRSYLTIAGDYNLESVSAVVVGGTSIMGGKGGYVGTIAGCIILQLVMAVLTVANIDSAGQDIIYGVIIIGVLVLYRFKSLRRS